MKVSVSLKNTNTSNDVILDTDGNLKALTFPVKANARGSSVSGGELLFLAIGTCFCNDIYREASKRKIIIDSIEVNVTGEFAGEGIPASHITYRFRIDAPGVPDQKILELVEYVDSIAEIHNTIRKSANIEIKF